MSPEDYEAWSEHPLTKQFHQYLRDYRVSLMERWANGSLLDEENIMAIARAQMADELSTLGKDTISKFYRDIKEGVIDAE